MLINQTQNGSFCVTNVTSAILLSGVPLGCIEQSIPSTLLKKHLIKCFISGCEKNPTNTTGVCSAYWFTNYMEALSYGKKQLN